MHFFHFGFSCKTTNTFCDIKAANSCDTKFRRIFRVLCVSTLIDIQVKNEKKNSTVCSLTKGNAHIKMTTAHADMTQYPSLHPYNMHSNVSILFAERGVCADRLWQKHRQGAGHP